MDAREVDVLHAPEWRRRGEKGEGRRGNESCDASSCGKNSLCCKCTLFVHRFAFLQRQVELYTVEKHFLREKHSSQMLENIYRTQNSNDDSVPP